MLNEPILMVFPQQETHALLSRYLLPYFPVHQINQSWDLFNTKRRWTFELYYTAKYQRLTYKRLKYAFIYTPSCIAV